MPIAPAEAPAQPTSSPPVSEARRCYVNEQYSVLVSNNRLGASEMKRLRDVASSFAYQPLVSIILQVSGARWLDQALDSVLRQIYVRWELCACADPADATASGILARYERLDERIKVVEGDAAGALKAALSLAEGEFVGLLRGSDELAPDALFEVVRLLQDQPKADLTYSDADEVDERGERTNPHFKPGWSPDLLLSGDYISHLSVYRRSLIEEVGGFRSGFEGCEGYDLVLRATERTAEIHHVAKILYHRRRETGDSDGGGVRENARRALAEALERRGLEGCVQVGHLPDRFRVRFEIRNEPKVSVIIPTRDNVPYLRRCLESFERLTDYRNYELLIIDNNSRYAESMQYLDSLSHRVIPFREPFNYSRINNFAVSHATGDYVLLLNDDTEITSGGWLEAMLEHAQRPEVGAVGARLLYPDGRIQHAGVIVGVGSPWEPGVAMHSHHFYSSNDPGYAGALMTTTDYSAVTAACMLLRRSVFEEVGGFEEEHLPIQFNDVDLCLRIRERGYYIVYTPYAELLHHESVTRGHFSGDRTENLYMRERWGVVMDKDPYYNANFSRGYGDFNLRADLLRPRAARQEFDPTLEPPARRKDPMEHQLYMEAQYRVARSSPRTTIIPRSTETNLSG